MNRSTALFSLIVLVLSFYFWDSIWLFPIRVFVVLLHELGHALAAVLTGGEIERIELVAEEGGAAWTRGGNRFLILNAGYLGSLLLGCLLLWMARTPRLAQGALALMTLTVGVTTLLYLRPLVSFAFAYGMVASVALLVATLRAPILVQQGLLHGLGLFSCLYALFDIRDDVLNFNRVGGTSDAVMLAELTGVPSMLWGLAWLGLSLVMLWRMRRIILGA
ncbi:MAG: M50 family metallopeptidase [Myxococcota bacterium]